MNDEYLQDPSGYAITFADGGGFDLRRLSDNELVGTYPTRSEAVAAAVSTAP